MNFTYKIRPATPRDVDNVYAMMKELTAYQNLLDCKITPTMLREDGFGKDPWFHCLIAEDTSKNEAKTVGYALFFYFYSTFKGRNVYLEDLYVKEPYRGKGIGSDMMKTVAKIALEKGCKQYRFACLGSNTQALKFYDSIKARDVTKLEDWHMMAIDEDVLVEFANKLEHTEKN